jgi:hypothetical protein
MKRFKKLFVYAVVFTLGVIFANVYRVTTAYYRLPQIWNHGEQLVTEIDAYKSKHGSYPSKEWFHESLADTVTIEGRKWIYLDPPFKNEDGKNILIFTRVDYGDSYHGVSSGGGVRRIDLESLTKQQSEQVAAPDS